MGRICLPPDKNRVNTSKKMIMLKVLDFTTFSFKILAVATLFVSFLEKYENV